MARNINAARAQQRPRAEAPADQHSGRNAHWSKTVHEGAVESPARKLQLDLEQSWWEPSPQRWSSRRSFAFIVMTSALMWAGLAAAVLLLLR